MQEIAGGVFNRLDDFGITRVADITGLDIIGIPVFLSIRPASKSLCVAAGKGLTIQQSKASAIMESIESYYAEYPTYKKIFSSLVELNATSHKVFCLKNLPRVNVLPGYKLVNTQWVLMNDLLSGEKLYFPNDLLHLDMTVNPDFDICLSSNGLAIGYSKREALYHAICELIERDSYSLWRLKSIRSKLKTFIPAESISFCEVKCLVNKINKSGLKVYLFNITSEMDVPTIFAIIADKNILQNTLTSTISLSTGHGCSLNTRQAMISAITEAAQSRVAMISASRDEYYFENYKLKLHESWTELLLELEENNLSHFLTNIKINEKFIDRKNELTELLKKLKVNSKDKIEIFYKYLGGKDYDLYAVRVIIPFFESELNEANYRPGKRAIKSMFNI